MLTAQILRELLNYNPETGIFTRKVVTCNKVKIGDIAGNLNHQGYIQLRVLGIIRQAHRLAWLYMTGNHPKGEIDHINGNRADNSFTNLRDVTKQQNIENQRLPQKGNKSKFLGVDYRSHKNKWVAQIQSNGVKHYLGIYNTPEEAHAAYTEAKRKLHSGCTL